MENNSCCKVAGSIHELVLQTISRPLVEHADYNLPKNLRRSLPIPLLKFTGDEQMCKEGMLEWMEAEGQVEGGALNDLVYKRQIHDRGAYREQGAVSTVISDPFRVRELCGGSLARQLCLNHGSENDNPLQKFKRCVRLTSLAKYSSTCVITVIFHEKQGRSQQMRPDELSYKRGLNKPA